MTKEELIKLGLSLGATYLDFPFSQNSRAIDYAVLRHLKNKKIFAIIYERNENLIVALKQNPEISQELREFFVDVTPAFHMNKTHWNDVRLGGDVPDDTIQKMIENSYDLIKPKRKVK
ncbi:MmcQ/YjbR family DNA-binding protein [Lactococcus allomyrinae]|uniref:MmcQ/YjbR family DNA-binding protein n=1 Tax=Lactococcus allomyrinae TaxID=2419773 RepID=A0A387BBP9_9LACT|nr:MmcQ/YjbR family DNA-binding protein [Lactococcus allomyrinae]AYG01265.1 MmcQ/YjbR family DNA-binding protein [Lactococcus allomyrinae]